MRNITLTVLLCIIVLFVFLQYRRMVRIYQNGSVTSDNEQMVSYPPEGNGLEIPALEFQQDTGAFQPDASPLQPDSSHKHTDIAIRPHVPDSLADFYEWPESNRVQVVSGLLKDSRVSPDTMTFIKMAIRDKGLSQHVRNIMSDVLHFQDHKDSTIYMDYIAMIEDETFSDIWRDYCVQHLALALPYSEDPVYVETKLHEYVQTGPEHLAGQSMMMLGFLEGEGIIALDKRFNEHMVDLLRDANASTRIQITALSLLAKRGAQDEIEVIRQYAREPSAVQRVALAALGDIGEAEDMALLESHVNSQDYLIALAAKGALDRMAQRLASH